MTNEGSGTIIKGVGGLYSVFYGGELYACGARGIFRKDGIKPLVGDRVILSEINHEKKSAVIDEICERKNSLIRPSCANVDAIVAVIAAGHPQPDLLLVDKIIVSGELKKTDVILVINKADNDPDMAEKIKKEYEKAVAACVITSTRDTRGEKELRSLLKGKTAILAGQSGTGKSSLTNLLCDNMISETGELSKKTERGKNTTRHTEMFVVPGFSGEDEETFIIDSPGFSLLESEMITPETLQDYYREIRDNRGLCRFQDCSHTGEPDCFVKDLVEKSIFPQGRYERYKILYKEMKEKERNKYK